ncbi:unnamed protein product [Brachionus calyciflorus]|uniref:BZIP domain-containing protein n=1 Tax=Brachionus calyciflorus TaxID=104777 RepID=A0A813Y9K0_9BILA|nr:unnamed protein product [Brachionus calyciflorus]
MIQKIKQRKDKMSKAGTNKNKVVCFGNKVVEKNTREYFMRRENNNLAVKKCRKKLEEVQRKREERMRKLLNENKLLSVTVDSLSKELHVLKEVILGMNPGNKLPADIEAMFFEIE